MDEYGINMNGDLTVEDDLTYDMGSSSKRIRTIYTGTIDATSGVSWPVQASAPTGEDAEPGDAWFDTANKLLRIRNEGDTEWLGVMYGNTDTKMYVYSNVAGDGWVVDAVSAQDVILALKGGANAYNVNGGNTAGTWSQPGHTHTGGAHTHTVGSIGASEWGPGDVVASIHGGPPAATGSGGAVASGSSNTASSYRPSAAVGTLQNLDV